MRHKNNINYCILNLFRDLQYNNRSTDVVLVLTPKQKPMFIYHKEEDYKAFTSVRALSDYTKIEYYKLTHQFGQKKVERLKMDGAVIVKVEPIRSKRK